MKIGGMLSPSPRVAILLSTLAAILAAAASRPRPSTTPFPSPVFDVGGQAYSIAAADFNRDGAKDLVVATNLFNGTLAFLMGNGDGTFSPIRPMDIGGTVDYVSIGDFNRDRKPDIVVVGDYKCEVLLGNGDGKFLSPDLVTFEGTPLGVPSIGDFDGDERMDLALPSIRRGLVEVFLGKGDGTFRPGASLAAGRKPVSAARGDFNQDGRDDLAVADIGSCEVCIFLGKGDGTFQDGGRVSLERDPRFCESYFHFIASDDFNADGRSDLAISSQQTSDISIFLGTGKGNFSAAARYGAGGSPSSFWIDDINGDGKKDLAVANYATDDVSILWGRGDGSFAPAANMGVGRGPTAVLFEDFNGDRIKDLAATFRTYSNAVHILLGNGDGSFGPPVRRLEGGQIASMVQGRFNDDSHSDLAVAHLSSKEISILLGRGDGRFNPTIRFEVGWSPISLATGDFNGDGRSDLAVALRTWYPRLVESIAPGGSQALLGPGQRLLIGHQAPTAQSRGMVVVLLGKRDGKFEVASRSEAGWDPMRIISKDLNGDGSIDLLVLDSGASQIDKPAGISILFGKGDGTFAPQTPLSLLDEPAAAAMDDFNADGRPDLVLANRSMNPELSVFLGKGDGTFGEKRLLETALSADCVVSSDFNADGRADLAVTGRSTNPTYDSSRTLVFLGNGDGSFAQASPIPAGEPQCLANGDFNADGKQDLAVLNTSAEMSVLFGNGDGTFGPRTRYAGAGPALLLGVADLNEDGRDDLVTAVRDGISVLLSHDRGGSR